MSAKKSDSVRKSEEPESFEKAMARLEKIVDEMESGSLALDALIGRFEEGQVLVKFCTKKLNEVERKVEVLVGEGETNERREFESSSESDDADEDGDGEELF